MPPGELDTPGAGGGPGQGVVAKAQLRFRVHPHRHPAARDVFDRVVSAYDERLAMIVDEVAAVLRRPDRGGEIQRLVLEARPSRRSHRWAMVEKAAPHVPFRPGSRGGTWYRDAKGNIRYGVPPEGRFTGNAGDTAPTAGAAGLDLDHLRPRSFMGAPGNDQLLTGFLVEHGASYGFSDEDLRFLGAWYGTGEDGGELFDAFLACAGLTRGDLGKGTADLRFGSQQLTYEEAVFEFFAAQGALFMGEDPTSEEQVSGWHRVLNDEVKPLLDGVFARYEAAKADPSLQEAFSDEPRRQCRRFFASALRSRATTRQVADSVVGGWDPRRQFDVVVAGMRALGLIARPSRVERAAYVHGRPHLRDVVVTDGRLLGTGSDNPLLEDRGKLGTLSASQLMLLYVAAELHRRWDPHSRSFSAERQADAGSGDLAEVTLAALSGKAARWREASGVVRARLVDAVDLLVGRLNRANAREGTPSGHRASAPKAPR